MIHIITRCSRPENLYRIYKSIFYKDFFVRWYIIFDTSKSKDYSKFIIDDSRIEYYYEDIGSYKLGYSLKYNIKGYIYYLDDDNIIHPDLYYNIEKYLNDKNILVFEQIGNDRTNYELSLENVIESRVDLAQFMIHSDFLNNDELFSDDSYFSDSILLEKLKNIYSDKFIFIKKKLSYYNYLKNK